MQLMFYYETDVFNRVIVKYNVGKGCNIILYLFHITKNRKHEVYKD